MNKYIIRSISASLALALCFALAGCASTNSGTTTSGTTETTTAVTTVPAETTTPTEPTTVPTEETTAPTEATTAPTETTAPVHEHVFYRQETYAATCANGGYVAHFCECGYSYTSDWTNPLGHSYTSEEVAPEGALQAYTSYTCQVCNHSYKDNFVWVNLDEDTSFFNDAAFIGDSITQGLMYYCMNTGALGNATFLCVKSYSVNNAVTGALAPTYRGQRMSPENALAACGAKKVFILLGTNDINLIGAGSIDLAMRNWATLIGRIRAVNPDITIYIQSGTPIYYGGQTGYLTNEKMDEYNQLLQEFAWQNGCCFLDIASYMKDANNSLAPQYCSDKYVHLTTAGVQLWINILKSST